MLGQAVRESIRYPGVWAAGGAFGLVAAAQLVLMLDGESFFSPRLLVFEALLLPFLLGGAYGALGNDDPSPRRFLTNGVANYFRVLLPALVAGFAVSIVVLALFVPLSLITGTSAIGPGAVAVLVVVVPVAIVLALYDIVACMEGLGVFAALRRSAMLVLAHPGEVIAFLFTILAAVGATGIALMTAWTAILYDRLLPLASIPPADAASFEPGQIAAMVGAEGVVLAALCWAVLCLVTFVLVTTCKVRVFRAVSAATPPGPKGEYDEKGRWYKY